MFLRKKTDIAVIRNVLSGNQGAFRVLVDRYAGVVHGVACAQLGNSVDAEEIVQETFVRLYQLLDKTSWSTSIGPWLVRVAKNACTDVHRRRSRECASSLDADQTALRTIPDPAREELHALLWEQLELLEPSTREVLLLHYVHRKKAKEIAPLLGISTQAATKRLQRAREELGRRLTDRLGDDLLPEKPSQERAQRIMAAVAALPVTWDASAPVLAAAVAGGAATKLAAALVAAVVLCAGMFAGYRHFSRPYTTQDITASSQFSVEPTPAPSPAPQTGAVATTAKSDTLATPGPEAVDSTVPEDPTIFGVVRGLVLTDQNVPAPGVAVSLDNDEFMAEYAKFREVRPMAPRATVRLSTQTGGDGSFVFSQVPIVVGSLPVQYAVSAHSGDQYDSCVFRPTYRDRELYFELVLRPDLSLSGMVTDADSRPVDEAWVSIRDAQPSADAGHPVTLGRVRTGADGRFALEHLPPMMCRLSAATRGFLENMTAWLPTGTSDIVIRLEGGRSISGRVIDAGSGQPLTTGYVVVKSDDPNEGYRDAKISDGGVFKVAGLGQKSYRFSRLYGDPRVGPFPYALVDPPVISLVEREKVTGLVLRAAASAIVTGRVFDAQTGKSIANRRPGVRLMNADTKEYVSDAVPKEDGRYRLESMPGGSFRVSAGADGYVDSVIPIELKLGETREGVDFPLERRPSVSGIVLDAQGSPVADASVAVLQQEDSRRPSDSTVTDTSGRFDISLVDITGPCYLQAAYDGALSNRQGPFTTQDAGSRDVVLTLRQTGRIEGNVVDQDGEPMASATVVGVAQGGNARDAEASASYAPATWASEAGAKAFSSISGRFLFPSLFPGQYKLQVYLLGARKYPLAVADTRVEAGRTLNARLVVNDEALGAVEGTVRVDGKTVSGQGVGAKNEADGGGGYATTDSEGHYRLSHLTAGEYIVHLTTAAGGSAQGSVSQRQTVRVDAGLVASADFDIQSGKARVEGIVQVNGRPEADVEVSFSRLDATEGEVHVKTDAEGAYLAEGLQEGPYRVEAIMYIQGSGSHRLTQAFDVQVVADQTARVDFDLVGSTIEGTVSGMRDDERAMVVVLPGDMAIPEWTPEAIEALGEYIVARTELQANGPFRFEDLPPGAYIVGVAALPSTAPTDSSSIAQARLDAVTLEVAPGATANAPLALP
jgi:RNA polymerase sigma-70 factor (ECF subfamily)